MCYRALNRIKTYAVWILNKKKNLYIYYIYFLLILQKNHSKKWTKTLEKKIFLFLTKYLKCMSLLLHDIIIAYAEILNESDVIIILLAIQLIPNSESLHYTVPKYENHLRVLRNMQNDYSQTFFWMKVICAKIHIEMII